ncbi:MAG: Holliday junction ATP-dependent DNA helicase RuvA [Fimbriimonadales bacterium]|nr:MAG: Holliday junction ATP-dependent DNA helicase RuvA [Fimbriimonadales bacterium]
MIGRICGTLISLEDSLALVDAGGVGYEVRLPSNLKEQLPPLGETLTLHIRTLFNEDEGILLFGFLEPAQRRLFDLLITVNGVGPRLALNLMGAAEPDALARAIARKDTRYLKSLPGVGAKLADRLALELSEKVAQFAFERQVERLAAATRARTIDLDALTDGLVQLGYTRREAQAALNAALNEQPDADEPTLMRLALAQLSPRR